MLCSASVNILQIMLSKSMWKYLSDFQSEEIVDAQLAWTSVTRHFIPVSEQHFPMLWRPTQITGRHHQLKGTVAKNQK